MGFVFYDIETTGTNTTFDQILQFAAVQTNDELDEVDHFNGRCRLCLHVVPSPSAMRVTGVPVELLVDAALPSHYAMMRLLREKLISWSPSLFIGYNSVQFDEHLLRQAFYQTLHPPYLTNTGGNCRADLLKLIRAVALFSPDALAIPLESGAPSFRLDRIAPANGFDHSGAHDALGDVQATLFLCKLLNERIPDLWSDLLRFTQKAVVIDHAASEAVFCLTDFYGGVPYSWLVTSLGVSETRKSDVLVFDLAFNPDDLRSLSDDDLIKRLTRSPKVVRRLRSNACPIIVPVEMAPSMAVARQLDRDELYRRVGVLRNDSHFSKRLGRAFEKTIDEKDPWPHVEQQIYDAFISGSDERLMTQFHIAPWEERLALIDGFEDGRLKQLGRRLIYLERPDILPEQTRQKMAASLAKRMINGDNTGSWLCLPKAIQEADDLISLTTDGELQNFLRKHRDYLSKRLEEMSSLLT